MKKNKFWQTDPETNKMTELYDDGTINAATAQSASNETRALNAIKKLMDDEFNRTRLMCESSGMGIESDKRQGALSEAAILKVAVNEILAQYNLLDREERRSKLTKPMRSALLKGKSLGLPNIPDTHEMYNEN